MILTSEGFTAMPLRQPRGPGGRFESWQVRAEGEVRGRLRGPVLRLLERVTGGGSCRLQGAGSLPAPLGGKVQQGGVRLGGGVRPLGGDLPRR